MTALILENPKQRKHVMKVQEVVQIWLRTVALPEINATDPKNAAAADDPQRPKPVPLGNSLLNQAREILQSQTNLKAPLAEFELVRPRPV